MSESVKLPDPVYNRANQEAEERGIPMGAVIEGWMRDSDEKQAVLEVFEDD